MDAFTRHSCYDQAIWALQTPWNNTPDTMYATRQHGHHRHCKHQETIQNTLWTPPDTAYTRKPYTGRYIRQKQPWTPCALQRPGNYTTDTFDTTMIHGQCRHQGTIQQTICTIPGTMDTMGNGYKKAPYSRHVGHHQAPWTPWLDRVFHIGKKMGDYRSPIKLKSLIEFPYVEHLKEQVLSFNLILI